MDRATFEAVDQHVDQIAETVDQALSSPDFAKLKQQLAALSKLLGDRYSVEFACQFDVVSSERERSLPMLNTGLSSSDGQEPYRTWADSTPHKYIVDGEMTMVPHDHCPKCWGVWDFKFKHHACSECGVSLGTDVKILLDSDVCPSCEEGKFTSAQPTCDRCGFEIDPSFVAWG